MRYAVNPADQIALEFGDKAAPRVIQFDGKTYDPARDGMRLGAQLLRVWALMSDGKWRTLAEISNNTGDPQASISARLRDIRKPKFGGHAVEVEHLGRGLYQYRLVRKDGKRRATAMPKRAPKSAAPATAEQLPLWVGPWPVV